MKLALDFEGNDSQNRTCCAQNVFPDVKNVVLPMSNLIPTSNRIAVIRRVFLRTYKKEFKCDGLRGSLTPQHVLFSLCFLAYPISRIPFIFKCILTITHLFPSQYSTLAGPQQVLFLIQLLKKYSKIGFVFHNKL